MDITYWSRSIAIMFEPRRLFTNPSFYSLLLWDTPIFDGTTNSHTINYTAYYQEDRRSSFRDPEPFIRKRDWVYRWPCAYFITMCTRNRIPYFGKVVDGLVRLSSLGIIADLLWLQIPHHARNIELGAHVVMPDHIHGILILNKIGDFGPTLTCDNRYQNIGQNSVSSIVGFFKSAVSRHARRYGLEFQWQARFHDRIIRDDRAFQTISEYIINNPAKWKEGSRHAVGSGHALTRHFNASRLV